MIKIRTWGIYFLVVKFQIGKAMLITVTDALLIKQEQ